MLWRDDMRLDAKLQAAWRGCRKGASEGGVESRREPITVPVGSKLWTGGGTQGL